MFHIIHVHQSFLIARHHFRDNVEFVVPFSYFSIIYTYLRRFNHLQSVLNSMLRPAEIFFNIINQID